MMPELLASDACALLCGGGTTGAGTTSSPKVAQLRDCRTRKRIRPKSSSTPERTVRPGTLQHRRTSTRVRPGAISHGTLTRELSSALSSRMMRRAESIEIGSRKRLVKLNVSCMIFETPHLQARTCPSTPFMTRMARRSPAGASGSIESMDSRFPTSTHSGSPSSAPCVFIRLMSRS